MVTLQKKHTNLENEFDSVNEKYQEGIVKQEAAEKRVTEVRMSYCTFYSNVGYKTSLSCVLHERLYSEYDSGIKNVIFGLTNCVSTIFSDNRTTWDSVLSMALSTNSYRS